MCVMDPRRPPHLQPKPILGPVSLVLVFQINDFLISLLSKKVLMGGDYRPDIDDETSYDPPPADTSLTGGGGGSPNSSIHLNVTDPSFNNTSSTNIGQGLDSDEEDIIGNQRPNPANQSSSSAQNSTG